VAVVRLPRPDFAGIPRHVVQRGNNRLPCFLDDEDRRRYLQCLLDALSIFGAGCMPVLIPQCLQQQKALGADRFRARVQTRTSRFATAHPPGRPPRPSNCP
jgi:hypothetical protein